MSISLTDLIVGSVNNKTTVAHVHATAPKHNELLLDNQRAEQKKTFKTVKMGFQ